MNYGLAIKSVPEYEYKNTNQHGDRFSRKRFHDVRIVSLSARLKDEQDTMVTILSKMVLL